MVTLVSACAGDVIYTNMPTQGQDAPIPNVQYFWEAFPSGSGSTDRTTYLFTYIDADPSRYRHIGPPKALLYLLDNIYNSMHMMKRTLPSLLALRTSVQQPLQLLYLL